MDQLTIDILKSLGTQGVLGALVVVLFAIVSRQQKKIDELQELRLKDMRDAHQQMLALGTQIDTTVDKLCNATDNLLRSRR